MVFGECEVRGMWITQETGACFDVQPVSANTFDTMISHITLVDEVAAAVWKQ